MTYLVMLLESLIFSFPDLWEFDYAAVMLNSKGVKEWFPCVHLLSSLPQSVTEGQKFNDAWDSANN